MLMGNFRDADKYFNRPATYLKNEHKLKEKTMESVFDYLEKNPTALVRGNVPIANIIERIKNRTGASYISKNDIPNLRMHRFNAFYLPCNETQHLSEDQLQIKAIKIPITDLTKHYTEKDYVSMNRYNETSEDYIYLAYEEQVRYLYSNSNKLFLEAVLARGISEADITNETEAYICYLSYLKSYLQHINQIPQV